MATTVFVTGANGFIAKHIVKYSLAANYKVIGSVRSAEKGEIVEKQFNSDNFSYVVIKSIDDKAAFDEFFKKHPEVTVVLHTATPADLSITDIENGLLIPAQKGAQYILESIYENAPQVKKFVYTSSFATHGVLHDSDPNRVSNEDSSTEMTREQMLEDGFKGYVGSKIIAENVVLKFPEEKKPNFKVSIVSPTYTFGPQAFDEDAKGDLNYSAEYLPSILKLKPGDPLPGVTSPFCDVRDVAKAHIAAFERDEVPVKRLFITEERFSDHNVLVAAHANFPELKGKIPESDLSKHVEVDKKSSTIENSRTKKFLGWKFYTLEQSVIDTLEQVTRARGSLV